MRKLFVLSFASTVILTAAATAQESSSTAGEPKAETTSAAAAAATTQDMLKKTAHGRTMLAREGKDPEEGRFMRALTACIRYYTGSH